MGSGEILPLQSCSGKFLLHRLHELINEIEVFLTRNPLMTPAEILRVLQPFGVVGSNIQNDRQRSFRTDAANECVQRELSDGNAQAARALIADAQNALAVGDDDDIDVLVRAISQQRGNRVAEWIGNKQASRPPIN